MRACAALLAVLPLLAADEDPTEVLIRLRDQVLAHSARIPNYLCVETIQREYFEPAVQAPKSCESVVARRKVENYSASLIHKTTDRLRLDVAMAENDEMYSWAGEAKFHEGDLDTLIPDGAIGTGPFASMLLGVFQGRPPRFTFDGETILDHRLVYQYSYKVLREDSHYRVKAHGEWLITGYDATLSVDPKTAELVQLAVRTDELPAATTLCQTDTRLDYGMVQLGGSDYLLPKVATQRFVGRDGSEAENRLTFASCREFRGESTLHFGEREGAAAGGVSASAVSLPGGLPVTIEILTAIHDDAAAGDRIEGRLAAPIRDAAGKVLVAAGAAAEGRLMRVEVRHGKSPESVISLRWEKLELDGRPAPVSLLPNRGSSEVKINGGGLRQRGMEIELPAAADVRYGVYHFKGEHVALAPGFRTEWTTSRP